MLIRKYWLSFVVGVPVTFHLRARDYDVLWTQIRGIQVGSWFIGAVRSRDYVVPPTLEGKG